MVLQSLKITGLFGLYSYDLQFRAEDQDSITFITGPNGYGKTTILSLIHALYAYDLDFLMKIPFKVLTVAFNGESGGIVEITQQRHAEQEDNSDVESSSSVTLGVVFRKLSAKDGTPGEELDRFEASSENTVEWQERESQLRLYMQALPCYYIKDQRLQHKAVSLEDGISSEQHATTPAVCDNAQKLQQDLRKLQDHCNKLFQVRSSVLVNPSEEQKKTDNQSLADKLYRWELIPTKEILEYDYPLPPVVDTFVRKLEVFEKIVERSEFANKQLEISPRFGYRFLAKDENRTILPCEGLSSGEQHLLILIYELLFRAEAGSLVLIDEPELSFHLSWQMDFLRNIREIMAARDNKIQYIVGTHSPQVFNSEWERSVDLYKIISGRTENGV